MKVIISSPSKESLEKAIQKFIFTGKPITCEANGKVTVGTTGELKHYTWRQHRNRFQLIENEKA